MNTYTQSTENVFKLTCSGLLAIPSTKCSTCCKKCNRKFDRKKPNMMISSIEGTINCQLLKRSVNGLWFVFNGHHPFMLLRTCCHLFIRFGECFAVLLQIFVCIF